MKGQTFSSYNSFVDFIHSKYFHKDEDGVWVNDVILDTQAIKKRESANMSNYSTFDGYKHDVSTFILEELKPEVEWLKPFLEKGKLRNLSQEDINTIIDVSDDEIRWYIDKLREDYGKKEDQFLAKTQAFLDAYLNKDLQDGTSFVSNFLGKMRAKIQ